jgi:hypothetical protein
MSSSSSWTQQKGDPFEHGLAKILFDLTIMLGNIIYEPIIYGNANIDYCYCYIRQMIENHTINVLVLFGILNSRFIVIINFAYIT